MLGVVFSLSDCTLLGLATLREVSPPNNPSVEDTLFVLVLVRLDSESLV